MKQIVALGFALAFCVTSWAQENFDSVRIKPLKITDQIYMLEGAGGNIGVLIGKEGTLMVDDQS